MACHLRRFTRMPQDIARDRVQQLMKQGAAIVEVLPREEFENEHLRGAVNLPLGDFKPEAIDNIIGTERNRAVVVYCQGSD
jgi:rhodanese-related sulfurtransferase